MSEIKPRLPTGLLVDDIIVVSLHWNQGVLYLASFKYFHDRFNSTVRNLLSPLDTLCDSGTPAVCAQWLDRSLRMDGSRCDARSA
jgi:hypothetical protein